MATRLANLTFDCKQPLVLSEFWSNAIDRPVGEGASEFFAQLPGDDDNPNWFFIQVPEDKITKNRVHIDLECDDMANEPARLIALGATHVRDVEEWGHAWSVFNDPEGNEFCVSGPH